MTTLWSWSSSTDTPYDFVTGTAPVVNTGGTFGQRYEFASTSVAEKVGKNLTAATDFGFRCIYTLASVGGSSAQVAEGRAAGALLWRVYLSTTGQIRIFNDASAQVGTGTVNLFTGTALAEHRFEMYRTGTTLTVKAYRVSDNVLRDTATGTVVTTAMDAIWLGVNSAVTAPAQGAFTYDEMVVTNVGAEIGPPALALSASAAVSPTSVAQGAVLTLTITAIGGTYSYTYAVTNWGDGTSSPSQSSNVFTKTLAANATLGSQSVSWTVTG